ncbi:MAG: DUF5946 family protein [Chloroflexota bacterium]
MTNPQLERCPDCRALLPKLALDAPTHRYMGGSASCWALFANMNNAGEPPIAPNRLTPLLTDAYAAQHFGKPSPQAINSVAIHLLALNVVFTHGFDPAKAQWVRLRAIQNKATPRHERFHWLTPPDFTDCLTVADIAAEPTAEERGEKTAVYVKQVYTHWAELHHDTLAQWYNTYIA